MRRDYFTCVFLALIAGALTFVCFKPLYFTYDAIILREFSIIERLSSVAYMLFFLIFLPCFSAYKKKEWINWGLGAYGLLAYLPLWFYPAQEVLQAEDTGLATKAGALCLRAIYAVVQAPFAALSQLFGDSAASKVVYWLFPVAVAWPVIFRIIRFYRRAYLSEQLNPMPTDHAAPATTAPEAPDKPEVLGTVITAPVTAQTPEEITRKSLLRAGKREKADELPSAEGDEKPAIKEGRTSRRAAVRAPVRAPFEKIDAPGKTETPELEAGPAVEAPKPEEVIPMGAPKPKADEAIPMGAPKPKADEAIPMGAPATGTDDVIPLGAPEENNEEE